MCRTHTGTRTTMAPEILEGNDYYDDKCDLWSIGVIIYQLFFGNYPYTGKTEVVLLNNIKSLGQNILKYTDNKQLDNLIRGLLVKDPKERISWQKYLYHPFFREYRSKEDYKIYYEKLDEKIGKGGFGVVYKAKDKVTNELRAMKIIDTEGDEEESEREIEQFIKELKNMDKCCNDYKNIYSIKIYDYFITKYEFIIIMELCDNNLYNYLRNRKKGFSSEEILKIMTQLNETFRIMVKENIVHRDIKLENILIKYLDEQREDFIVKLNGYGCSKQLTNSTVCKTIIGTASTMAPEIMEGNEKYDNKCDLWSIGIIIYQLFFNKFPYNGMSLFIIYNQINKLGQKVLKNTGNKQLDDLIRGLLIKDPKERLSWEEYFNHPFFKNSSVGSS